VTRSRPRSDDHDGLGLSHAGPGRLGPSRSESVTVTRAGGGHGRRLGLGRESESRVRSLTTRPGPGVSLSHVSPSPDAAPGGPAAARPARGRLTSPRPGPGRRAGTGNLNLPVTRKPRDLLEPAARAPLAAALLQVTAFWPESSSTRVMEFKLPCRRCSNPGGQVTGSESVDIQVPSLCCGGCRTLPRYFFLSLLAIHT
jgi:hypothetical protein